MKKMIIGVSAAIMLATASLYAANKTNNESKAESCCCGDACSCPACTCTSTSCGDCCGDSCSK